MDRNSRRGPLPADLFTRVDDDSVRADWEVFGRRAQGDRRGFLRGAGLATIGALVGAAIPFHRQMPAGLIPVALANEMIAGKDGLTLLNDRPLNAKTPPNLLDNKGTPTARHFIRNDGISPEDPDMAGWWLIIDGLVDRPMTQSVATRALL